MRKKTVEVHQLQFVDEVVGFPVVLQRRCDKA